MGWGYGTTGRRGPVDSGTIMFLSTSSCRKAVSVTLKRSNSTASGGKFKVVVVGGGTWRVLLLNVVV